MNHNNSTEAATVVVAASAAAVVVDITAVKESHLPSVHSDCDNNCVAGGNTDVVHNLTEVSNSNCSACNMQLSETSSLNSNSDSIRQVAAELTETVDTFQRSDSCMSSSSEPSILHDELVKVKEQLHCKELECKKLTEIQNQTGLELQELTASLFEEANKMVQDAHIKRMAVEKLLLEANAKVEILQAELTALKALVLTSTPQSPNPHLNPQIDKAKKAEFTRGHRRSTSHHNFSLSSGAATSPVAPVESPVTLPVNIKPLPEPPHMSLFRQWKCEPNFSSTAPFLSRIITEDILPCLNFANVELSKLVYESIFNNTITVEPLLACAAVNPDRCALSNVECLCRYCVKLGDAHAPFAVSQPTRNRITAVCDLITYLRYISQGLVKSDEFAIYWEIARLRKKMCVARLGLGDS